MKQVVINGQRWFMGRNRPSGGYKCLRVRDYLTASTLPPPPVTLTDYLRSSDAMKVVSQVYMNQLLGCCVISGLGHALGVIMANAGQSPLIMTDAQTVQMYQSIGGTYIPGHPDTDLGCDEQTAMNWWQTKGF